MSKKGIRRLKLNLHLLALLLIALMCLPSTSHAQTYSAQSGIRIIREYLTFHYYSLVYKAENNSIFAYDGADAYGPRLTSGFQTTLDSQMKGKWGMWDYWAAAISWTINLQTDLHVSGNVEIRAYISSNFSFGFFDGGGYAMGLVDAYENGTVIQQFTVEGPQSIGQNPFTSTPKAYTLNLDVDYVFKKEHVMGVFVGIGSNRQGFTASVYFDSSDRNSGVTLPVEILVDNYEYSVVIEEGTFDILALSNSNLSNFGFSRSEMQISFNVSGLNGTYGYCEVWIPKSLLGGPFKVFIDDQQISRTETGNNTHSCISFTYVHDSDAVRVVGTSVISEFPLMTIIVIIIMLSLSGIVLSKLIKNTLNSRNPRSKSRNFHR